MPLVKKHRIYVIFEHLELDKINIGRTSRSEYYDFMVQKENLIELMHQKYALYPKFIEEYIMIPKYIYQQQEQIFRKLRETSLSLLKFEYPL